MKDLKDEKINTEVTIENEKSMEKRIKTFRKVFDIQDPLDSFDRDIFESLVEKVILGDTDENEINDPYVVTFILKTGLKLDGNCKNDIKSDEGTSAEKPCSFSSYDKNKPYSQSNSQPRGDGSIDVTYI